MKNTNERSVMKKIKHMITRLICLLLFALWNLASDAQNLVPNPSFESLRNLPVKPNPNKTFEYEPKSGYIPYIQNLRIKEKAVEYEL